MVSQKTLNSTQKGFFCFCFCFCFVLCFFGAFCFKIWQWWVTISQSVYLISLLYKIRFMYDMWVLKVRPENFIIDVTANLSNVAHNYIILMTNIYKIYIYEMKLKSITAWYKIIHFISNNFTTNISTVHVSISKTLIHCSPTKKKKKKN